jgi:quinol monooxygenase YgiN
MPSGCGSTNSDFHSHDGGAMTTTPISETKLTVIATFTARPGKEADLRALLLALLTPTRGETGCLNYDLHNAPDNPAKFLFHENWASQAHLDAHLKTPHISAALRRLDELCIDAPILAFWRQIG